MITAIIVDDEPFSCEALATLLERYCPNVIVVDICYAGDAALISIREHQPHLLFLDIEMPLMNGFELLEQLPALNFDLVFTTSYDQYAIKAIQYSALDYLLKPVEREALVKAVQKSTLKKNISLPQQIAVLLQKLKHPTIPIYKIPIPTMEGLQMVLVESVICCKADDNYTVFNLKNNQKIIASRTLKEMEELLEDFSFARVHHSYLVNLNEVDKYIKGEGGSLVMSDGSTIDVSRNRKKTLLAKLKPGLY